MNNKGFTAIEIIVVMVIIGILSNMALLSFGRQTKEAEDTLHDANLLIIKNALELYAIDNGGKYPVGNSEIPDQNPLLKLLQDEENSEKKYYLRINPEQLQKFKYESLDGNDYVISIELIK